MEFYARMNLFYHKAYTRAIRLVLCFTLLSLALHQFVEKSDLKLPLFFLNIFIMIELFFRYKIAKMMPHLTAEKNKGESPIDSFTLPAAMALMSGTNARSIVQKLFEYPSVRIFMQKADIIEKEISTHPFEKKVIASSSLDVAKTFHAKFVTTLDLFIAYLMLTEPESKLLFAKQLKNEDLSNIILWLKREYPDEETPRKNRLHLSGDGIGEALTIGWTPETKKYTSNFTTQAVNEKALITGREKEFKMILEGLIRTEGNNVLLVGDIGSGKENLVRAFAYHSFEGNIGSYLNHRRILQLLVGKFVAGANSRSDLETRLQAIVDEASHAGDVILYIPEFQNIMGASSYNLDISGAIQPYLQSNTMPIIATMTTGNYKTYMERNPLKEAFTVVHLAPPSENIAIQMVLEKLEQIEKKNKVIVSYRAVASSVTLSARFFQDESLPGSAITLLQNVAAKQALVKEPNFEHTHKKILLEEHVVKYVEATVHVSIAMPGKNEIDVLLHLEDKLHERIIGQEAAINAIAEAMRRVRSGMSMSQKPVSFLFLGPTGVGKTETTKALSDLYFGGETKMIRLDMSEYADETGLRRLLGAPPGQGTERGELTDKIHDAPASLVLLDEFEKAYPKILDLFLQVLDDGRLTDNKGMTVSFRNALIIATSNAGSEFIREEVGKGTPVNKQFQNRLLDYLQSNKLFKPELLNRFDGIITFKPLGKEEVRQVIHLILKKITDELAKQDIKISFDDALLEKIAAEGFDPEFGARPLSRYVQDNIEDLIAKRKLTGEIVRGKSVNVGVDGASNITLTIT